MIITLSIAITFILHKKMFLSILSFTGSYASIFVTHTSSSVYLLWAIDCRLFLALSEHRESKSSCLVLLYLSSPSFCLWTMDCGLWTALQLCLVLRNRALPRTDNPNPSTQNRLFKEPITQDPLLMPFPGNAQRKTTDRILYP